MANFWKLPSVRVLSIVLLAQAGLFYGFSRHENVPAHQPLSQFSFNGSNWTLSQELPMDQETLDVLKADDLISRAYQNRSTGQVATLFVAYFDTQRTGKAPHSPKNCLPGSGWAPSRSGTVDIPIPGQPNAIHVNRYIVSRGENQSVVLYWYQARNRIIASEYTAKIYTVADSLRYNRSDTALVRVVVEVENGDTQKAFNTAESFVQAFFEPLKHYLPA